MTKINYCTAPYDANLSKNSNGTAARRGKWAESETEDLKSIVENHTHSPHVWQNGQKATDCLQSHGIIIDFDNEDFAQVGKLTVKTVQAMLDGFETHIYSSQSHLRIKKTHEDDGEVERFHTYIPFENPIEYELGKGDSDGKYLTVFNHFNQMFNGRIDQACKDLARVAFPSADNPNKFYEYHPGRKFNWDTDACLKPAESFDLTKPIKSGKTFDLETEARLAKDLRGKAQYKAVKEIDEKKPIYCPFCDDEQSDGPSAFISFTSEGIPFISCSHCVSKNIGMIFPQKSGQGFKQHF